MTKHLTPLRPYISFIRSAWQTYNNIIYKFIYIIIYINSNILYRAHTLTYKILMLGRKGVRA